MRMLNNYISVLRWCLLPSLTGKGRGVVLLFCLSLFSCHKAEPLYDSYPAYFIYVGTNTVPQLNAAMGGMGEFCTIEDKVNQYVFANMAGSTPVNKTAISNYQHFHMGRGGGFIVGLPTYIADTSPHVVCYDIVCPNCFELTAIAPHLNLISGSRAECSACQRTYDLNNLGILASGLPGRSLYRYNASYSPYTLVISN